MNLVVRTQSSFSIILLGVVCYETFDFNRNKVKIK